MDLQGGEYSLTPAVTSVNTTGVAGVASGAAASIRCHRPRSGGVEETSGDD